ncbi:hypothetical protein [Flaviaesturariibacter terrae]
MEAEFVSPSSDTIQKWQATNTFYRNLGGCWVSLLAHQQVIEAHQAGQRYGKPGGDKVINLLGEGSGTIV